MCPGMYETLSTSSTHGSELECLRQPIRPHVQLRDPFRIPGALAHLPQKLLLAAAIPGRKLFGQLNLVKRKLVLRLVMQPIHGCIRCP